MPALRLVMNTEHTIEGVPVINPEDGTIHRGELVVLGGLPQGMVGGKPSAVLVLKLDNGDQVFGETSLRLLVSGAKALESHYAGDLLDPEEQSRKTLGQIAFEAYTRERGGKNHDGTPTPPWDVLGDGVRNGWQAAAASVLVHEGLGIHS